MIFKKSALRGVSRISAVKRLKITSIEKSTSDFTRFVKRFFIKIQSYQI